MHMTEIKDMYYVAKMVQAQPFKQINHGGADSKPAAVKACLDYFNAHHRLSSRWINLWLKGDRVLFALDEAEKNKYIEFRTKNGHFGLFLSSKGHHFVAKKWLIRIGLIDESAKTYKETRVFILGITNLITALVAIIITYFITKQ